MRTRVIDTAESIYFAEWCKEYNLAPELIEGLQALCDAVGDTKFDDAVVDALCHLYGAEQI